MPSTLYVEGVASSSSLRDIGVKLSYIKSSNTLTDDRVNFTCVDIDLTHIKFDHTSGDSADGIDICENATTDITVPEWVKDGQNKPAAYKRQINITVQAKFSISPSVATTAKIRATTSDAILGSLGEQTVSFSGGESGYVSFTPAMLTHDNVGYDTVTWQWKIRDIGGQGRAEININSSGPHKIYVVLDTPTDPMVEPWTEVLDIACYAAAGMNTKAAATWSIWNDFYNSAGAYYDVNNGESQYTTDGETGPFNLTSWLEEYSFVYIVNCYDMAKSVVTFANALGCGTDNSYVSSFGYLNCVKPVGRGWTNNPFYENPNYNPNQIVPDDWDINDGRSGFGNHAFCRLSSDIYDASGGQVDVDGTPDAAPHTARELDGDDTWDNSYEDRVIDDDPDYPTTAPANNSFSVY